MIYGQIRHLNKQNQRRKKNTKTKQTCEKKQNTEEREIMKGTQLTRVDAGPNTVGQ